MGVGWGSLPDTFLKDTLALMPKAPDAHQGHQPKNKPTNIRRGESGGEWKGGPLWSPASLFIWLESCGNMTPPHPAGDHKGPPNPSSSTLAPTNHPASCLASRLRLMPI